MGMEQSSNVPLPSRIMYNTRKERISFNNFVLTDGIFLVMVLLPLFEGLLIYGVNDTVVISDGGSLSFHNDVFQQVLLVGKLSMLVLIAFVLTFRFAKGQENGTYGYWLALGVEREKFYLYTILALVTFSTIGIFLSILIQVWFFALYADLVELVLLFVLIFVSQAFFVVLTLFLEEFIEWSEITFITVLVPYFVVYSLIDINEFPANLFFAESGLLDGSWFTGFGFQLIATLILGYLAYSLHLTKDMELGG